MSGNRTNGHWPGTLPERHLSAARDRPQSARCLQPARPARTQPSRPDLAEVARNCLAHFLRNGDDDHGRPAKKADFPGLTVAALNSATVDRQRRATLPSACGLDKPAGATDNRLSFYPCPRPMRLPLSRPGLLPLLAGLLFAHGAAAREAIDPASCTLRGHKLYGKIQVVNAFPDLKVRVVTAFPQLKVKKVDAFPDRCGELPPRCCCSSKKHNKTFSLFLLTKRVRNSGTWLYVR